MPRLRCTVNTAFGHLVRKDRDTWYVTSAQREIAVSIDADPRTGVVDFRLRPEPGVELLAGSRVIPRGRASEYAFTQFQAPGMPDEAFMQSVRALEHELSVLKAILEVECPS
jgi:hypothetical protein